MEQDLEARIQELKEELSKTRYGDSYVEPYKNTGDGYMGLTCDILPDAEARENAENELKEIITRHPAYAKMAQMALQDGKEAGERVDKGYDGYDPGPGCFEILFLGACALSAVGYGIYRLVEYITK